jgi:hypothetical protein
MTIPEERRRGSLEGLRQYLADWLLTTVERRPRLQKHLLELTSKLADNLADGGQARRAAHLQSANEGLKARLPREASRAINLNEAPGVIDQQHIADMMRWWMKHDPLGASRSVVEAVGLGGAYRLSEGERQRLARAFLAMLNVDPPKQPYFESGPAPPAAGQNLNGFTAAPGFAGAVGSVPPPGTIP